MTREQVIAAGLCAWCRGPKERGIQMCNSCAQKTTTARMAFKERCREKVFAHYGERCACCGETERAFLVVDHIGGGGHAHRQAESYASANIYGYLVKTGLPPDFRILCSNCNHATKDGKPCPHQRLT
jgi:hypothetical protein